MYFYEIMETLMEKRNLKVADVAKLCGLPDSTVRSIFLRKQKSIALEIAFKISKGLNVSLELLNGDNESVDEIIFIANNEEEKRLLSNYRKLDKLDRGSTIGYIESKLEQEKYKKGSLTSVG